MSWPGLAGARQSASAQDSLRWSHDWSSVRATPSGCGIRGGWCRWRVA